jgi:hypothetical protein
MGLGSGKNLSWYDQGGMMNYVFILAWLEVAFYFSVWTVHSLIGSGIIRVSGSGSGFRRAKMTHKRRI